MALFKKLFKKKEGGNSNFHLLTVTSVEKNTEDTVVISLETPSELKNEFQFVPGQYLTGKFKTSKGEFNRSYSICSDASEDLIQIACKEIEGGKVSTYLNQELKAGTQIQFMKPAGNFLLADSSKKVTAICAGSGITPIMSMIKNIESRGTGSMDLFYGSRNEKSIIFKSEIENTSDRIQSNIFLSAEESGTYSNGRITPNALEGALDLNSDVFYLCGPEGLIFSIKDFLKAKGVTESKIKFELFTTPVSLEEKKIKSKNKRSQLEVLLNGNSHKIEVDASKTILDSLQENGIEAPFSCKGAVCCTCKGKITEGSAEMKMNLSLNEDEIADGYVLTCQTLPTSENIKLTFDE